MGNYELDTMPVIQELSASILLFSSNSITLAVAVYNLYETGYTEPTAALAMVSMAITSLALLGASWLASRSGSRRAPESAVPAGAAA